MVLKPIGIALQFAFVLGICSANVLDATTQRASPASNGNIPSAPVIQTTDPRYPGFKQLDDLLLSSMDTTINPCEDFYGYTCRKRVESGAINTFDQSKTISDAKQLANINNDTFFNSAILPLKQLKYLFDKCVRPDATKEDVSTLIKRRIDRLKSLSEVEFPLINQKETTNALTPEQLGRLIGYSMSEAGISSFVNIFVMQDAQQPDKIPARVYVDQVELYRRLNISQVLANCQSIAAHLDLVLDEAQLKHDVAEMVELENALLTDYYTDAKLRRNFSRGYNPQNIEALQEAAPAFNWIELIRAALARANADNKISKDLTIIVVEPAMIAKIGKAITNGELKSSTIANYVHYRAISATVNLIAEVMPQHLAVSDETAKIIRTKTERWRNVKYVEPVNRLTSDKQQICLDLLMYEMTEASNRYFADSVYPTPESRITLKTKMTEMKENIFNGFRTQINRLNWMSADSKKAAYEKLNNVLVTIGFQDWVTDDEKLIEHYKALTFTENASTLEVLAAIENFTLTRSVENFRLQDASLRRSMSARSADSNAAYMPEANAIFMYGGLLNTPAYDPDFPVAFNLGSIGVVFGHELVHGFDDGGVQYDSIGALKPWLDENSTEGFSTMEQCIIDQYSAYCPAIGSKKVYLNGNSNQGENIADNGGIRASYNALKAHEALNGPEPRLPSFGSVFNSDQLFFLGFARFWCWPEMREEVSLERILTDPHSPALYRVLGTLQNFPAFRAAFNCPVGSVYAPEDHCDVWSATR